MKILLFCVLLCCLWQFGTVSATDAKAPKSTINKVEESPEEKILSFKKSLIGQPFWQRLIRFPYKTCTNWAEIQRNQTDFVSTRRQCITNCFFDDLCSGILMVLSQSRGCRYLSGMCASMESYQFEYFHKPVSFTKSPFIVALDDRSVRFTFEMMTPAMSRCWLFLTDNPDTCEASMEELDRSRKLPADQRGVELSITVGGNKMLPKAMLAVEAKIPDAFSISNSMMEATNYVYFDLLPQQTHFEGWCANSAGFYSNPVCFTTPKWILDMMRHAKQGCQDTLNHAYALGFFVRVGLLFCREMCVRRNCYSFMYGRSDGKLGGQCVLSKSCGKKVLGTEGDLIYFNTYTQYNLDFQIIKASAKCTASPNPTLPAVRSMGSQFIHPMQCRKACIDNVACEFFLFGKAGASKGSCMMINSDCKTFEPSERYDVWQMIRLDFSWYKMESECMGANIYLSDDMDFKSCKDACRKKMNCNYFIRADINQNDRGLCLGANQCDKTRVAEGFYIYLVKVPPPLFIEDQERQNALATSRMGGSGPETTSATGGGGQTEKKDAPVPGRRRRLREMIHKAGFTEERMPQKLDIPVRSRRLPIKDHSVWVVIPDVAWSIISHPTFVFYSFPVIFGALFGSLAYIWAN